MGGDGHAGDALHAQLVRLWQGLNNGDLVTRHQAVLPGQADATG